MKVLIVKTSSMGDIIHTLPAITDAANAIVGIEFHWVVEEGFQEIPRWLPNVKKVIPVALRRWRKQGWLRSLKEIKSFISSLREDKYDLIIDAQGLFKSGVITRFAKGPRAGADFRSAREPIASLFYNKKYTVLFAQHAITRTRELMAKALGYKMPVDAPHSVVDLPLDSDFPLVAEKNTILFFHGTTWPTKHWPESYWHELAQLAKKAGLTVLVPWGSPAEHERAQRITETSGAVLLPQLSLAQLASLLHKVTACVAVDTGLGHLAASFGTPTVSLYGPTNPALTGTLGRNQYHLSAKFDCAPCMQEQCQIKKVTEKDFPPCFTTISPQLVLSQLLDIIYSKHVGFRLGAVDSSRRSALPVHEDGEMSTATTPKIDVRRV
ncbi:MAG: lipopolysaccharide heptosyltransferase I [Gammaproteobacteria bacterium]|nr:lipopolysaccharide heptosyltransferase I [Gammaproteobacteria bacterium]